MEKSKSIKVEKEIIELLSSSDEDTAKPDPQQQKRKRVFSDDDSLLDSPRPSPEVSQPIQRDLLGQTGTFSNSLSTSYKNSQRSRSGGVRPLIPTQLQFSNATQDTTRLSALSNASSIGNSLQQMPDYNTDVPSFPSLAQLTPGSGFLSASSSTTSSRILSNYNGGATALPSFAQQTQMSGIASTKPKKKSSQKKTYGGWWVKKEFFDSTHLEGMRIDAEAEVLKREHAKFRGNLFHGMKNFVYSYKKAYTDMENELVESTRGIVFSNTCRYKRTQCDGPIEILDEMERDGLCMSVFLKSFNEDGTIVKNSVASKSKKTKTGWGIFGLKWLMEMFFGYIPRVPKFTFIEYGGFPLTNGTRRQKIYSYLRCEELIAYMKAKYDTKAESLLKNEKL
ncbi:predicted protein [Chaetoceros tenuissimus]|uniref:Uncharacterized protein n=1 Tax=Chaetoceros tenuissimus TaxID=426638 RepID=A0AAD3GZ78_9STRA|nr:predicted protein [Chaetoceros tenuissimus]GFH45127.1 predicted protein [Chaetoceros tenuissimus]